MKTRIILVRHGQSSYNLQGRIQGHCDESSLTELGQQQARKVGSALLGISFDAVYASSLQRASQTAALVVAMLRSQTPNLPDPICQDTLKEISLPLWEGLSFEAAETKYPTEYKAWRQQPEAFCMQLPKDQDSGDGGTEAFYPMRELYQRAQEFWQTLLPNHPGQTILVVAHSAINRALISVALDIGPEKHNQLDQANCCISVLNFSGTLGDKVQIESMNLTSHMGQPLPPMRKTHRGPRMLLVRHGETDWNRDKRFQGQRDIPLNDNGRAQGAKAAEFLKAIPIDAAVSSSMLRPKETAELILQHHPGLDLRLEDGLREIGHGEWEGMLEADIEAGYPGLLQQWQDAPETVQMPGGENLQEVWQRAIAAWKAIVAAHSGSDTPKTVLVTAHDAVNKAILCHVLGFEPNQFWTFKQGNGAVSVIDYPDGVGSPPVLKAMNITTHLTAGIFDQTAAGAL
ncbi:MAG: histidine phosphatase family protein [Cyanobacteria bacterium P01_A01_bin.123]